MCQITRQEIHVLCRLCEAHFSCVIPRKSYLVDRPFLTLDCSSVSRASKKNYRTHLVFTVTCVPEGGSPVEFTSEALFD